MPEETIEAFQDHGVLADTLEQGLDDAREVLAKLAQVGVDYDDVTDVLEKEGVEKFTTSFEELKQGIREKREQLATVA
jgi:transaldolase